MAVVPLNAAAVSAANCENSNGVAEGSLRDGPQSQVAKWLSWGLDRNGNGVPVPNLNNAVTVLERDPSLAGLVWFDEFLQRLMTGEPAREWCDADDIHLTLDMQRKLGIQRMSRETVSQAVIEIAYSNVRNCQREFLDSLPAWDGIGRCDIFFPDVFGASDTDYTRAVGGNFWKSLIVRGMRPGAKVDNMVVLEGGQGIGKSTAVSAIVGAEWFAEARDEVTQKDFFVGLQGKWLIEISELDSFTRADVTKVKQAVSCCSDRFRPPYGRKAVDHPRRSIFVATTNKDDWNRDETGARRFWPIRCTGDVRIDLIKASRLQYMAEARARIAQGESWWEMPDTATRAEQESRRESDVWESEIAHFLIGRDRVTSADIFVDGLKQEIGKVSSADQRRVWKCLKALGWVRVDGWHAGRKAKYWMRKGQGEGATP